MINEVAPSVKPFMLKRGERRDRARGDREMRRNSFPHMSAQRIQETVRQLNRIVLGLARAALGPAGGAGEYSMCRNRPLHP